MKIFYADDDRDDRVIFCDVILGIDPSIEITCASDGQEALDVLSALPDVPDVIFLDINMPRKGGIECLEILRSREHFANVPVVIYSTITEGPEIEQAIAAGATRFASKAYSYEEIVDTLSTIIKQYL